MQVQDLINVLMRLHPKDNVEFAVPVSFHQDSGADARDDESRTEFIRITHEPAATIINLIP